MINLDDVSLLQYSRQNFFFGDSVRYACRDNLQIQTSLYDLTNMSGVSGIIAQLSGMSEGATDWQPIILRNNSTYLGLGRINNVNFAQSNDVRQRNVTIDLTIFNTGNIFSLNTPSPLYSGVNFSNPNYPVHLIEEFSENFSISAEENGDYIEQQSIDIQFVSGAAMGNSLSPASMGRQFCANLLVSNPVIGYVDGFYAGRKQAAGKRNYTESINLISNRVSLTETFRTSRNLSGSYSINYTNSLSMDEAGIVNVRESARVQGLAPDIYGNYYYSARSGAQYEANNFSYLRCSGLFSSFIPGAAYPLNSRRVTYGQTLNQYADSVNYEVSYSNDPKINNNFSWEYTQEIEKENPGCTYKISENGNILGYSTDCSPANKFSNALVAFSGVKTGIYGRIYNFYTGFSTFANEIKIVDQNETKNKFAGTISYARTYTDNLLYSYSGARKISISLEDEYSVPGKNLFEVPNYKQIVQPNNIPTLSKRSLSLNIQGLRGTVLTGYQNLALNLANSYIPTVNVTDPYISNLDYSWQPLQNVFDCKVDWTYYQTINLNGFLIT